MIKKLLLCLALVLLTVVYGYAACTDSSPNYYADTTSQADRDACMTMTIDKPGAIIHIPAGSATWTTSVSVYGNRTLMGAGMGQTNITTTATDQGVLLYASDPSLNHVNRVSGFTWLGTPQYYIKLIHGSSAPTTPGKYFRIDHNEFSGVPTVRVITTDTTSNGMVYGVIDANLFHNSGGTNIAIQISPIYGPEYPRWNGNMMWSKAMNPGSDEAIYIENNTFITTAPNSPAMVDTWDGGKVVVRYNNIANAHLHVHGPMGNDRGGQWMEVYNNSMNGTYLGKQTLHPLRLRSGSGYFFRNLVTGYENNSFRIETGRGWDTTYNVAPFYMCDASRQATPDYDNPGGTPAGYPCLDGCGRVGGVATSVYTEVSPQAALPIRSWLNGATSMDSSIIIGRTNTTMCELTDYSNDASAPVGYTPYTCPHPIVTDVSGAVCDASTAGTLGYGLREETPWPIVATSIGEGSLSCNATTLIEDASTTCTLNVTTGYLPITVTSTPCTNNWTNGYTFTLTGGNSNCAVTATFRGQYRRYDGQYFPTAADAPNFRL